MHLQLERPGTASSTLLMRIATFKLATDQNRLQYNPQIEVFFFPPTLDFRASFVFNLASEEGKAESWLTVEPLVRVCQGFDSEEQGVLKTRYILDDDDYRNFFIILTL